MLERPHRRAKPEKIERPHRLAHRDKIERPHRRPKSAQIVGFPGRLYFVTDEDREAQREAERIFAEMKGRCPCCGADDDGYTDTGALCVVARWGRLIFACRMCGASHERIAAKIARRLPRRERKDHDQAGPSQRRREGG